MTKTQRQHRIAQLLSTTAVTSQAQLVGLLKDDGIPVTQATVSRDLVELGAIKARSSDGVRTLALPGVPVSGGAPPEHLRRVLAEWVVEVTHAGPLVVVKTPPGCAHVVGSALDRGLLPSTLGTVAGDDTLFVVADERVGAAAVAGQIREIAGIEELRRPRARPRRSMSSSGRGR